jgi:hypothetical protein
MRNIYTRTCQLVHYDIQVNRYTLQNEKKGKKKREKKRENCSVYPLATYHISFLLDISVEVK